MQVFSHLTLHATFWNFCMTNVKLKFISRHIRFWECKFSSEALEEWWMKLILKKYLGIFMLCQLSYLSISLSTSSKYLPNPLFSLALFTLILASSVLSAHSGALSTTYRKRMYNLCTVCTFFFTHASSTSHFTFSACRVKHEIEITLLSRY